jgi:hypothetical protein
MDTDTDERKCRELLSRRKVREPDHMTMKSPARPPGKRVLREFFEYRLCGEFVDVIVAGGRQLLFRFLAACIHHVLPHDEEKSPLAG